MAGRPAADAVAETAAFELERFEWTADKRIEVEGRWLGVRGRRFVRPTLTLRADGEVRRMLALLDHKPWDPSQAEWIAAFAWDGEHDGIDEAELAVAPGVEVMLPAPREAGAKPVRRKPKRYEARVAPEIPPDVKTPARVDESAQLRDELTGMRAHAERVEAELADVRTELAAVTAELASEVGMRERTTAERDQATAARDAALRDRDDAAREREASEEERADTAVRERSALQLKLDAAIRSRDTLRNERDTALAERDAALGLRDAALAERESMKRSASLASLPRSSIYTSSRHQSFLSLWTPRLIALGIVIAFVVIVVLLFHGS